MIKTCIILLAFLVNSFGPYPLAQADDFRLPALGVMVRLSPPVEPPILRGIKVHPDNPFRFDFILDKGDSTLSNDQLRDESGQLVKYFLASLTIPENDLWVNLSPYEKDRIIPQSFGLTEMGRDLLAEDYMLKQVTASLIYPEDEIGKKFWKRIYAQAAQKYGTTNIPVNTFNKVWIVPEKAVVYENAKAGTAYVIESKLKVMLEQDYLSLEKHSVIASEAKQSFNDVNSLGSQVVREIVIPELTKEINENKNFAKLRQVYNSLILAAWYKKKIKDSILAQVYADKKKIAGVGYENSSLNIETIYQSYLKAFKKGVYNYIREEQDPITQETIPRKYFSGGINGTHLSDMAMKITDNPIGIPEVSSSADIVSVDVSAAPAVVVNDQGQGKEVGPLLGDDKTLGEVEMANKHRHEIRNLMGIILKHAASLDEILAKKTNDRVKDQVPEWPTFMIDLDKIRIKLLEPLVYIEGSFEFEEDEFNEVMTPEVLIKALKEEGIDVPVEDTPIKSLNMLLRNQDLYQFMKIQPEEYQIFFISKLKKGIQLDPLEVIELNRVLIERNFPLEAPNRIIQSFKQYFKSIKRSVSDAGKLLIRTGKGHSELFGPGHRLLNEYRYLISAMSMMLGTLDVITGGAFDIKEIHKFRINLNQSIRFTISLYGLPNVIYKPDPNMGFIPVDDTKLMQVVINLIKNATEAGAEQVTVRTRRTESWAQIIISDNGSGMSEATMEHIFTPGVTSKADRGGSGLGLAICREIIQAHGGNISVKSELGKGSTFTISLPFNNVILKGVEYHFKPYSKLVSIQNTRDGYLIVEGHNYSFRLPFYEGKSVVIGKPIGERTEWSGMGYRTVSVSGLNAVVGYQPEGGKVGLEEFLETLVTVSVNKNALQLLPNVYGAYRTGNNKIELVVENFKERKRSPRRIFSKYTDPRQDHNKHVLALALAPDAFIDLFDSGFDLSRVFEWEGNYFFMTVEGKLKYSFPVRTLDWIKTVRSGEIFGNESAYIDFIKIKEESVDDVLTQGKMKRHLTAYKTGTNVYTLDRYKLSPLVNQLRKIILRKILNQFGYPGFIRVDQKALRKAVESFLVTYIRQHFKDKFIVTDDEFPRKGNVSPARLIKIAQDYSSKKVAGKTFEEITEEVMSRVKKALGEEDAAMGTTPSGGAGEERVTSQESSGFDLRSDWHDFNNIFQSVLMNGDMLAEKFSEVGINNISIQLIKMKNIMRAYGKISPSQDAVITEEDIRNFHKFKMDILHALVDLKDMDHVNEEDHEVRDILESDDFARRAYVVFLDSIEKAFHFLTQNGEFSQFNLQPLVNSLWNDINMPTAAHDGDSSKAPMIELISMLPASFSIFSDREAMTRVFENLLKNGREAILTRIEKDRKQRIRSAKGIIWIAAYVDHLQNRIIEVRTNGGAMPEKLIEKIFINGEIGVSTKPARVYVDDTDKITGAGIGLPGCLKIIRSLEGTMEVETNPKERTTTFIITLPLLKEPTSGAQGHLRLVASDEAQLVNPSAVGRNGGIDLTAANMNLQTQNAGEGIKFHLDPAMLQQLQNAPGFVPVIVNIQPMNDLREFLGINAENITGA